MAVEELVTDQTAEPATPVRWTSVVRGAAGDADGRVVVVPHAAAGPIALMPLLEQLPENLEVLGVTLPGRERRIDESCVRTPSDPWAVVDAILAEVAARPPLPTALFGHSIGAAIAAALVTAAPGLFCGLVLSATPSEATPAQQAGRWTEDELLCIVRQGGVTPDELFLSPQWRRHVLDLLRSDLTLGARLAPDRCAPELAIPLTMMGGTDDRMVIDQWSPPHGTRPTGPVRTCRFRGGHFYLLDEANRGAVASAIADSVRR